MLKQAGINFLLRNYAFSGRFRHVLLCWEFIRWNCETRLASLRAYLRYEKNELWITWIGRRTQREKPSNLRLRLDGAGKLAVFIPPGGLNFFFEISPLGLFLSIGPTPAILIYWFQLHFDQFQNLLVFPLFFFLFQETMENHGFLSLPSPRSHSLDNLKPCCSSRNRRGQRSDHFGVRFNGWLGDLSRLTGFDRRVVVCGGHRSEVECIYPLFHEFQYLYLRCIFSVDLFLHNSILA